MTKLNFSIEKEKLTVLRKEGIYLLVALVAGIILFKIIFYNENLINVIKFVLSLFWLFLLPGYSIIFYWEKKLDFLERLIIGTALSIGLEGIFSYYFGLLGLNIKSHAIILPLLIIITAALVNFRRAN